MLRPLQPADVERIVAFAVEAWRPVSDSMRRTVGAEIYDRLYPDWPAMQARAVRDTVARPGMRTVVADDFGDAVGFAAFLSDSRTGTGVIEMLAVDRAHQGRGIGRALTDHAFAALTADGMTLAVVETGGDPGHAPARRVYERAGATAMPIARYFRALQPRTAGTDPA